MEREANYTAVGAFVILVAAMAVMFVYWYSEGRDRRSYVPYEIYFSGSISGLSEGGAIRYLGVDVGRVRRIRLDTRGGDRVQVIANIDKSAPIDADTRAQLSLVGITGLLFIDLKKKAEGQEEFPAVPSERYPVIVSVRSDFDRFLSSLPEIAGGAAELMQRAQLIFSVENTEALAAMISNLHEVSANLPATMKKVDTLVTGLNSTSQEVRRLAEQVRGSAAEMTPELKQLSQRLNATAGQLESASKGMSDFIAQNQDDVAAFTRDGLPQLQRTLEAARAAADSFKDLTQTLRDDPSQILYQAPQHGVKVPR
jgi:phospholipid/cholesterol/gamma-HCH transport system substrate-binding protein